MKTNKRLGFYPEKKNFGRGRRLEFAVKEVLREVYGTEDHYQTRKTHLDRFLRFATWMYDNHEIRDAREITLAHVMEYGVYLRSEIDAERIKVSYAQNLLSTVNTCMMAFRRDRAVWCSPSQLTGNRQLVRDTVPCGSWLWVGEAVRQVLDVGLVRTHALIMLCRGFGLRVREAALADLDRLLDEARRTDSVTILDGCKGGRRSADRVILLDDLRWNILVTAAKAKPAGSHNLLDPEESYREFRGRVVSPGRAFLKAVGIPSYQELRAAFAVELYEQIAAQPAPVRTGRVGDREADARARAAVGCALGHGRSTVARSYVGGVRMNLS